jgi:hypothetical protein
MRVGVISDTHLPSLIHSLDELGPECGEFLSSVDLILHSGDISTHKLLDWCEQFAPVVVARGNHDVFEDPRMDDRQLIDLEGWRIGMVHDLRPRDIPGTELSAKHFDGEVVDMLIAGDTHVEQLEQQDGVVILNSGSPNLPHHKETRLGTAALLQIERGAMRAEIVLLGESDGVTNPGTALTLELTK